MRAARTGGIAALALAVGLGLAACSSGPAASSQTAARASASTCGTIPTALPSDPDGALAALPASVRALYNGYPVPVYKSAFASWKPKSSVRTIGLLQYVSSNPYQLELQSILAGMLKSAGYTVDQVTSSDEVTSQVADFNHMVKAKVAAIVYEPLSPSAFTAAVTKAAAAGIPSVSVLGGAVASADTISVGGNEWLQGAEMAAQVAKDIGGSGRVLDVHGIAGAAIDLATFAAVTSVFARCPGISANDSIYDQFEDSTAKTDVRAYLKTHPQKIAAAITSGAGATGVMEAFRAAGKTVPEIANASMEDGELAYWYRHRPAYKGVGITTTPAQLASGTFDIVKALFAGKGVRISAIVLTIPLVTNANVAQWYRSGMTTSSTASASAPAGLDVLPASELTAVLG
jgi:ABC-type sugar transport system substrate-binding protein